MTNDIDRWARILWDYQRLDHELRPVELAVVLGSHDLRVADRAAEIYAAGLAPLLIFSGGAAPATRRFYAGSEAGEFAARCRDLGVPESAMRLEEGSHNTAENLRFSRALFAAEGLHPPAVILVQKPYMERRSLATAMIEWPDTEVLCTSPRIAYEQYPTAVVQKEHFINTMVGDLQRLLVYPKMGFMAEQAVPAEVLDAYQGLVACGFTARLLDES